MGLHFGDEITLASNRHPFHEDMSLGVNDLVYRRRMFGNHGALRCTDGSATRLSATDAWGRAAAGDKLTLGLYAEDSKPNLT